MRSQLTWTAAMAAALGLAWWYLLGFPVGLVLGVAAGCWVGWTVSEFPHLFPDLFRKGGHVIFGPDLSHYQQGEDLAQVAAEGCAFVIGKVSQGASSRDPAWPTWRDCAPQHGLLLIGYHMITGDPPAAQAANCKAALGDPSIPLALDWEASGGSGTFANFLAVLAAFRAAGLNVRLAYCPRWYWEQQGSPDMSKAGLPLWSSRYVTATGTPAAVYQAVTAAQWAGYGGLSVGLVQFSDRATIAGRAVDCSAFNGTRAQLAALLGGTAPTTDQEEPMAPVPINIRSDGTFAETVMVEAGASSAVVAKAWITYGSTFGTSHFKISALDGAGHVMGTQLENDVANNRRGPVMAVPDGAVMATIEGRLIDKGARPGAALITLPK